MARRPANAQTSKPIAPLRSRIVRLQHALAPSQGADLEQSAPRRKRPLHLLPNSASIGIWNKASTEHTSITVSNGRAGARPTSEFARKRHRFGLCSRPYARPTCFRAQTRGRNGGATPILNSWQGHVASDQTIRSSTRECHDTVTDQSANFASQRQKNANFRKTITAAPLQKRRCLTRNCQASSSECAAWAVHSLTSPNPYPRPVPVLCPSRIFYTLHGILRPQAIRQACPGNGQIRSNPRFQNKIRATNECRARAYSQMVQHKFR